eukprot:g232.t1
MDTDGSNKVDFDKFMHWYRRIYPTRLEDVIAELTYEFNKFDVEKTGGLSDEEVSRLMKRMRLIKPGQTMEKIIASLPKSSLGDVRFEDFQQWHMKNYKEKYQFFNTFSKSKAKRRLSTNLGELETDFQLGTQVEVYFRRKDKWIPGFITKIEQSDGTAQFCSNDGHQHKWVNMIGHEHANVIRLLPPKDEVNEKLRVDLSDGGEYTKAQFIECYGGTIEWDASHSSADTLKILIEKVSTLEGKVVTFETAMKEKDDSINDIRVKYQDAINQNARLKTQLHDARDVAADSKANEKVVKEQKELILGHRDQLHDSLLQINELIHHIPGASEDSALINEETEDINTDGLKKLTDAVDQLVQTLHATEEKLEHEESVSKHATDLTEKLKSEWDEKGKKWKTENENLKASIEAMKKKGNDISKWKEENKKLKSSIETMKQEVRDLSKWKEENQKSKASWKQTADLKMENLVKEMKKKTKSKEDLIQSLSKEIKMLKKQGKTNDDTIENLQIKIASTNEKMEKGKEEIKRLGNLHKQKLDAAKKEFSNALADQTLKHQDILKQASEKANATKEKHDKILKDTISEHEDQIEKLVNANDKHHDVIKTMTTRSRTLEEQLNRMVEEVVRQDDMLKIHIKKEKDAASTAKIASADRDVARDRIRELQLLITGHLSLEKKWELEIRTLKAEIKSLQTKLSNKIEEMEAKDKKLVQVKAELFRVKDNLSSQSKIGNDIEAMNKALSTQNDDLTARLSNMKQTNQTQNVRLAQLTKENKENTSLLTKNGEEIVQLKETLTKRSTVISALTKKCNEMKELIDKLKKDFNQRLQNLEGDVKEKEKLINALTSELQIMKAELEKKKKMEKMFHELQLAHDLDAKETRKRVAGMNLSIWMSAARNKGKKRSIMKDLTEAKKDLSSMQKKFQKSQVLLQHTRNELQTTIANHAKDSKEFETMKSKLNAAQRIIQLMEEKLGSADVHNIIFQMNNLKRQLLAARKAVLLSEEKAKDIFNNAGNDLAIQVKKLKEKVRESNKRSVFLENRLISVKKQLNGAKRQERIAQNALLMTRAALKTMLKKNASNDFESFLSQFNTTEKEKAKFESFNPRAEISKINMTLKTLPKFG